MNTTSHLISSLTHVFATVDLPCHIHIQHVYIRIFLILTHPLIHTINAPPLSLLFPVERVLKLVCTEDEMLEETFQLLWPDGTATDLEAVKVRYVV